VLIEGAQRSVCFPASRYSSLYYSVLYLLILLLMLTACSSLYEGVLLPTDMLNPDAVRSFVRDVMGNTTDDREHVDSVFAKWREESDISDRQWLTYFALSCPFWCSFTWIVCACHTYKYAELVSKSGSMSYRGAPLWSDCVCVILVLPAIYGLMTLKSVIRCLQIYINHVPPAGWEDDASQVLFHSFEERRAFLREQYTANFAVGDIMEAVALITFGEMMSDYLERQMSIEESSGKMSRKGIQTVSTLTVFGVQLFCLGCVLSGGWDLVITTVPLYFPDFAPWLFSTHLDDATGMPVGSLQRERTKAAAEHFLLGFSFAASFAAIGNIMKLEQNFEEELEEFAPSLKFWGTKILVTLACVQSCLFAGLAAADFSEMEIDLIFACTLSFECFLIAIFHLKAWDHREPWLQRQREGNNECLLPHGPR